MSLIVIGTGTDVGKTITCAALLWRYEGVAYWKPVATGARGARDASTVRHLSPPTTTILEERYRFAAPLSPHHAAARQRQRIEPRLILRAFAAHRRDHTLLVEGIGGLLVPLTQRGYLLADLVAAFGVPCLLVARSEVGTINHTLLTIEAMRTRSIPLVGVVLSGPRNRDNRDAIERFGRTEVLGELTPLSPLDARTVGRAGRRLDPRGRLSPYLTVGA